MKIAQVAPLWERVPPFRYGGIELVVSLLTEELIRRGHEVTLFASGDSITDAKLVSVRDKALRFDPDLKDPPVYELLMMGEIFENADQFDIIHSHVGFATLPYGALIKTPIVHTTHGIFTPDNEKIFSKYKDQAYLSISDAQREERLGLNYVSTVYNGIETSVYPFEAKPQDPPYMAFVGRMSPEKGPEGAVKIARATGMPLKMAGKVDAVDVEYFEAKVKPMIDGEQIQYLGEVSHEQKSELLRNSALTLFPITWREPFGLVMVEAMASGSPVIGSKMGSVPEVVAHGKTGFVCETIEEMIEAVPEALKLDRQTCRDYVEENFSVKSMVDSYLAAYEKVLNNQGQKAAA